MLLTKLSSLGHDADSGASAGVATMHDRLTLMFLEGSVMAGDTPGVNSDVTEWDVQGLPGRSRPLRLACQVSELLNARTRLELICYDRPLPEPGWLLQTKADLLLCWFPTNEIAALPVAALRDQVLREPARLEGATVLNKAGLSWLCVEDTDFLVWKLADARVLDTHFELNEPERTRKVLGPHNFEKGTTLEALLESMVETEETPKKVYSEAVLKDLMSQLAPVNRMGGEPTHRMRIRNLPWKV